MMKVFVVLALHVFYTSRIFILEWNEGVWSCTMLNANFWEIQWQGPHTPLPYYNNALHLNNVTFANFILTSTFTFSSSLTLIFFTYFLWPSTTLKNTKPVVPSKMEERKRQSFIFALSLPICICLRPVCYLREI